MKKLNIFLAGHLFFLVLMLFAILHYQERMIYIDSAWYSFQLTNNEEMILGRPIAILTQLIPYMAVKVGVSLKTVLLLFSCSFIIAYYGIFLLIAHKLKSRTGVVILCLSLLLCVRESFYNPVSEIFIGCAIAALFYAFSVKMRESKLFVPVSLLIVVLCFYSHPTTVFLLVFACLYRMAEAKEFKSKLWIPLVATCALFSLKSFFSNTNVAEGPEIVGALSFTNHLSNFFDLPAYTHLASGVFSSSNKFVPYVITLLLSLGFLVIRKKWIQVALVAGFTVLFIAVTNAVYASGESSIVLEKSIVPLAFFAAIPFARLLQEVRMKPWIPFAVLMFMFFIKFRMIGKESKYIAQRIDYYKEVAEIGEQLGQSKFLITQTQFKESPLVIPWAVPVESMLASSIIAGHTVTIAIDRDGIANNEYYLPKFMGSQPLSNLNKNYYILNEEPYIDLK